MRLILYLYLYFITNNITYTFILTIIHSKAEEAEQRATEAAAAARYIHLNNSY